MSPPPSSSSSPALDPDAKARKQKYGPYVALISGGTAGGVECACTYPFEFAKTRVQLKWDVALDGPPNPFRVVSTVVKNEGVSALYTGCTTLIVGSIGKDALRFITFDYIRATLADPDTGKLSPLRSLGSGMLAGVVASIGAVTPTERIKTALIDDAKRSRAERQFAGPLDAIRKLTAIDGPAALYRGFWGTTLKQASTTAVRLGSYDMIKNVEAGWGLTPNPLLNLANGSVVGATTVLTTQPFDVIKTRTQSVKREGIREAIADIRKDFGIKGFWKGSTMRLGRNVFSGAILFSVYEEVSAVVAPLFGIEPPSH